MGLGKLCALGKVRSGLCYSSPAALCENIAFFPRGRARLELMPGVTRWSPALSARVPWKAKDVWAGCSPLCCARMGFLQKMLEGGWTESHRCIQDVGSVELTKDVRSALLGQSGIAELSLCF